MIKPDPLVEYHRKTKLRQCVNGTCYHGDFCLNRKLNLKDLQPTPEEREAWNKYHRSKRSSSPLHREAAIESSKNWKRNNRAYVNAKQKEWAANNPDKIIEINRKHREKNKQS